MTDGRIAEINDVLEYLGELEDAIHAHVDWIKNVHRTLIFKSAAADAILTADAHLRCPFGKWYASVHVPEVLDSGTFAAIGEIHENVTRSPPTWCAAPSTARRTRRCTRPSPPSSPT